MICIGNERKKEKSGAWVWAGNGRCLSVSLSRLGTVTKMMLFVSHWQINRCCAAGIGVMVVLDSISPDARERERESVREWIVEHPVTAFLFIFIWVTPLSVCLSLCLSHLGFTCLFYLLPATCQKSHSPFSTPFLLVYLLFPLPSSHHPSSHFPSPIFLPLFYIFVFV